MTNKTAVSDTILTVNMRVELLIDFGNELRSYMSRVEGIDDQRILVALPTEHLRPIEVPDRSPVRLIVKKNGICFLSTFVLETCIKTSVPVIVLAATHCWERVQRRGAYRLETLISLDKAVLIHQGGKQEPIKSTICNLSHTGALLDTSVPLPEHGRLLLGFTPSGELTRLEVSAEVVRLEPQEGRVRNPCRVGVRFIDFIEGDVDVLVRVIFKQQMAQSRGLSR